MFFYLPPPKKKSKCRFGAIFWEEFAVGAEKILIIIGSSAEKLWEQTDLTALQFFWAKSAHLFGGPLALRVESMLLLVEVPHHWRRESRSLGAAS